MLTFLTNNGFFQVLLRQDFLMASKQAGALIGPIANFLGKLYNAIFEMVYSGTKVGTLGIAIIVFTIVVKMILMPLMYNQQKAAYKLRKVNPLLRKVREKYAGRKDMETQRKLAEEIQQVQRDNGVSTFSGCLPLLIQLPLLYALFYIFQQAYQYVDIISANYNAITDIILQIPVALRMDLFRDLAITHGITMDLSKASDILVLVNEITIPEWSTVVANAGEFANKLLPLLTQKQNIESFLGLALVYKPSLSSLPTLLVPILAGITTYISTSITTKQQNMDEDMPGASTMKTMTMIMPIMMGFISFSVPMALGIYWTLNNVLQLGQMVALNKYFEIKDKKEEFAAPVKKGGTKK